MKASALVAAKQPVPVWLQAAIAVVLIAVFLGIITALPVPLPPYLDFQVLYQTDMALLRGISPYDHAGQVNMIAQLAHVPAEGVIALPFPYPPWYALITAWLAWLPIESAVRTWFGISILLLLCSICLLTDGWPAWKRLLALALSLFVFPVLGSLAVGQYGFPVLLGAALLIYALRKEQPWLVALAAALLTFKPHLGGLILLGAIAYLWRAHTDFAKRALINIAIAGILLCAVGFLADPAWPVNYFRSLTAYGRDSRVAVCALCGSLPAILAGTIPGAGSLRAMMLIGAILLAGLTVLVLWRGRNVNPRPDWLIGMAVLVTLLGSPYLLNYDFLLLVVPLVLVAADAHTPVSWAVLGAAYIVPSVALAVWGRDANVVLPLCALILLIHQIRGPLDVSMGEAYNHSTTA